MDYLIERENTSDENLRFGILLLILILIKVITLTSVPEARQHISPLPSANCLPMVIAPEGNIGTEPTAETGSPAAWTLGGATGLLEIICQEEAGQIRTQELEDEFRHERELSSFWR